MAHVPGAPEAIESVVYAAPYQPPDPASAASGSANGSPTWLTTTRRRMALGLILLLAATLDFYALNQEGYANEYYAAGVKSMTESWHNFFFVSFDPGGFVTIDKPPLGFWIQAISAKIFGFSGFSLLLPEALAGVLSCALLYLLVKRYFGPLAGLLAALALAITPISVVTNRNNTIDSLLVLCSLGAAWFTVRAAERGQFRWLALAGLLVGLGFNIKMLEAYLVVPALVAVYLFAAPLSWRKRLLHLAGFLGIMLVVSASWITLVDMTPAAYRPWVGSTSTNSELDLALGYNGIERLLGMNRGASSSSLSSLLSGESGSQGGVGGASENGPAGLFRLFDTQLGGQTSWLLPLALIGLFASGWSYNLVGGIRRAVETASKGMRHEVRLRGLGGGDAHFTARQASWALWGGWTLTMVAFFSIAGFYHTYYLSMLAPGIAALAAISTVEMWNDYRRPGALTWQTWQGWLLPAALLVTGLVQAYILASYPTYAAWMAPLIIAITLLAAALLVWRRLMDNGSIPALSHYASWLRAPIFTRAALGLALAVLLLPALIWSGVSLAQGSGGTLPHAGPTASVSTTFGGGGFAPGVGFTGARSGFRPRGSFGGFPGGAPADFPGGNFPGANGGGGGFGGGAGAGNVSSALIDYLEAHQGSAKYLVAVSSANQAAPIILSTGKAVMALGGFTGSDPILTVTQLQTLIREGQIKYFLVDGAGGGFGGGSGNGSLLSWVEANCTAVSSSAVGTSGLYACSAG